MKITMYELLGMIKDGKAPKKIKINNDNLTLSKTNIIQYNFERSGQLNWDYYIENYRLDEKIVEILEEEKKIPEKLPKSVTDNACSSKDMRLIAITINQLIDYLKAKVRNNER
jgi:hypothetical protein